MVRALQLDTPEQFRDSLSRLFPSFEADTEDECTFHSVLMDFTPFFGRHFADMSKTQLQNLARLINIAYEARGSLANAFDTCFFEGLPRGPAAKALRPFLSTEAKER